MDSTTTRRRFLAGAAALPLTLTTTASAAASQQKTAQQTSETLPPPKYTLSVNLELMFPRALPFEERLEAAAKEGAKAFSFWGAGGKDLDKLRAVQEKYGLACGSITGSPKTGWNTGLTKTGFEKQFLDDFSGAVAVAKKMRAENLITFVGATQKDIPLDVQHAQIIAGLRKAGDIACAAGVYLTLEPLSSVESPQMSVLSAKHGFRIIEEVNHPHIKLDFDMYHLQLSEGNLTNNLKLGLNKGWIRFVEVGDVPGRFEPGTGEVNYAHIFRTLRELNYAGYIGMEHRAKHTYKEAIAAVRRLAGLT